MPKKHVYPGFRHRSSSSSSSSSGHGRHSMKKEMKRQRKLAKKMAKHGIPIGIPAETYPIGAHGHQTNPYGAIGTYPAGSHFPVMTGAAYPGPPPNYSTVVNHGPGMPYPSVPQPGIGYPTAPYPGSMISSNVPQPVMTYPSGPAAGASSYPLPSAGYGPYPYQQGPYVPGCPPGNYPR